jgi:uncharacterized protein YraI
MRIENFAKSVAVVNLVALSSGLALAAPAVLETNAKVRSGPGTQYQALTVLPGGTTVDVMDCSARWCAVAYGQRQGYVARSLLDVAESDAVVQAPPAYAAYPAARYSTYPSLGYSAYYVGPIYADYYSLGAYGPYGAWPAPSYPYYRDYYFRPGLSFGVGLGF